MLAANPLIVTVCPLPAALAIVTCPLPLEVRVLVRDLMLTRVPASLLMSGLEVGKEVSLSIGTKPPISSTRAFTLLSIACVVAIFVLPATHVSLLSSVSEDAVKYLASAALAVKS